MLIFLLLLLLFLLFHPPFVASLLSLPLPPPAPIVVVYQQQQEHRINHDNASSSPLAVTQRIIRSSKSRNNLPGPFLLLALLEQQEGATSSVVSSAAVSSLPASSSAATTTKGRSRNNPRVLVKQGFQADTVVRVTDANHVRLQRAGLVALAAVKTPSSGSFSECLAYAPEYKLLQLLPAGQDVQVKLYSNTNTNNQKNENDIRRQFYAVILKHNNNKDTNSDMAAQVVVNQELVAAGFAVVRKNSNVFDGGGNAYSSDGVLSLDELKRLETAARLQEKGLFQQCVDSSSKTRSRTISSISSSSNTGNGVKEAATTSSASSRTRTTPFFVAEFQPLDEKETTATSTTTSATSSTTATTKRKQQQRPKNPGDNKGCSDFETYEDALRYYEYYYSWGYGDVAKLDRDHDGIPCPGLPHTQNQVLYRIKKPKLSQQANMVNATP
jgi:endonuclease YncB( thermonuclease family)